VYGVALSDKGIMDLLLTGKLRIEPLDESCINPAGYDLRCGQDVMLNPGRMVLSSTVERVQLPNDLVGVLHLRSSLAREGLIASLALVDPGFRGQLTVMLYNAGGNLIRVKRGERFLQISFFKLVGEASRGYSGVYQDSRGVVKSLRGESMSLSNVGSMNSPKRLFGLIKGRGLKR
jgi:dCTP deaminase